MLAGLRKLSHLPSVSIIIPTFNEEEKIGKCLQSIFKQNYPFDRIEVIVVDGMSSDNTVDVARKYPVRVVTNEKIIIGAARRLGVEAAKGEILVFIDADNELPQKNWLRMMVKPLMKDNPYVAGSFPIIWPKKDHPAISRCYALVQANPIVAFVFSTGKNVNSSVITKKNYFPMGGNGFLFRRDLVLKAGNFRPIPRQSDVDMTYRLIEQGYEFVFVPEAGIYHLSHKSFSDFLKKMYKRVSSFCRFSSLISFSFLPRREHKVGFLKKILYHLTVVGALFYACRGIQKEKDLAWLYYPIVSITTILLYGIVCILDERGRKMLKALVLSTSKSS